MFDGSTEDLPSYIPGYEEWLEEREKETAYDAYDAYIDRLIDERELGEKEVEKKEREEEKENDEQKREKTI